LQRDRDAAERDEQELRAQRGRAAAGAVHDLRNELSLALMYAQRATEEDAGPLREALAAARDLAHDALAHGSAALSLRRVELFPLIQKEAAAAIAAARRPDETSGPPRVRVRCSVERTALVDPRGFARALRNALTNAAEAALRRGPDREVRVEVRPLPETGGGALGADALRRGGYGLELEVADEGVGMSRAELARFLEPRLTARSAAHSTGFGTASLELGLTRSAVPLRVVSGRGRGTRVTFFLRSDRPAEVLLERDVRRAERRAGPGRAVVANEDAARALGARPAAT
ncbi:MAG: ATP-binding protein, partial [Planctomycetota bacterium]